MKTRLDPIDRDILRALYGLNFGITATKIADRIGIHPVTAIKRLSDLIKLKLVLYTARGNRKYYRLSLSGIKRFKFY